VQVSKNFDFLNVKISQNSDLFFLEISQWTNPKKYFMGTASDLEKSTC